MKIPDYDSIQQPPDLSGPIENAAETADQITETFMNGVNAPVEAAQEGWTQLNSISGPAENIFDRIMQASSPETTGAEQATLHPAVLAAKEQLNAVYDQFVEKGLESLLKQSGEASLQKSEPLRERILREFQGVKPEWTGADVFMAFAANIPPSQNVANHLGIDTESRKSDGKTYVVTDRNGNGKVDPGEVEERQPGEDEDVIYYTNGMNTSRDAAHEDAAALSAKTGKPVVVVFNATEGSGLGFIADVGQCALDQVNPLNPNPATKTDEELMYQAAKGDKEQTFVAHSQGGIITRNALMRVHLRLYSEKFMETLKETKNPVESHLTAWNFANEKIQNVHIITAGGAGWAWPPYANVDHVVNTADPIPNFFGQMFLLNPRDAVQEITGQDVEWLPGGTAPYNENESVDVVHDPPDDWLAGFPGHSFQDVYLDTVVEHV